MEFNVSLGFRTLYKNQKNILDCNCQTRPTIVGVKLGASKSSSLGAKREICLINDDKTCQPFKNQGKYFMWLL